MNELTVNQVITQLQIWANKFGGDGICKVATIGKPLLLPVVGVGIEGHGPGKPADIIIAIAND